MIKRFIECFRWARRLENERGEALVELALIFIFLLLLVSGLIDFSQMIFDKQVMCGMTRQGSDLASRGTSLTNTVTALGTQGESLNIGTDGRIIVTEVADGANGKPQIIDQAESPTGISVTSAVGSGDGTLAAMPAGASTALSAGHTFYVTEVFYNYTPIIPFDALPLTSTSTLYEAAYF